MNTALLISRIALIMTALSGAMLTGCQSPNAVAKTATPPPPLPKWVDGDGGTDGAGGGIVLLESKLIEITREAGDVSIPAKPYAKRMNDREKQEFLRNLQQRKGADLMSSPSVVSRMGQRARVEIGREIVYPKAPGENPEMLVVETGVLLEFRARSLPRVGTLRVDVFARALALEGFVEVSPGFSQPSFTASQVDNTVDVASGETFVLGGILREDTQAVEDRVLGIITKRSSVSFVRELIVLVTPTIVDANGRPARE